MPSAKPFHWFSWVAFVPTQNCEYEFSSSRRNLLKDDCHPCWQRWGGILVGHLPYLCKQGWSVEHILDLEHLVRCQGLCLGPKRARRSWWWSACQPQACVRCLSQSSPSWLYLKRDFTSYARLLIKTAILMPEAQDGEVTIVEVETLGYNKAKVIGMICLLSQQSQGNRDDSTVITIRSK